MSLSQPTDWTIPDETLRVARAAFSKPSAVMRVRDELGVLYDDQDFATLFATRGQPAESPLPPAARAGIPVLGGADRSPSR